MRIKNCTNSVDLLIDLNAIGWRVSCVSHELPYLEWTNDRTGSEIRTSGHRDDAIVAMARLTGILSFA